MHLDMQDRKRDWTSRRARVTLLVLACFLLLSPVLLQAVYQSLNPVGALGSGNGVVDEDTYLTSIDNASHSGDAAIKVGNQSVDQDGIVEIAYIRFEVNPPPAGSYLSDLYLVLECQSADSGGVVGLHKTSPSVDGFTLDNLSYAIRPSYEPCPFANLSVDHSGNYTVRLFVDGGFKDYTSLGVIAITAERGTRVSFYSSEAAEGQRPKIVFYSPMGNLVNLRENPAASYLNPQAWYPVFAGFVLLSFALFKSFGAISNRQRGSQAPP
jgi:hypothetical protein